MLSGVSSGLLAGARLSPGPNGDHCCRRQCRQTTRGKLSTSPPRSIPHPLDRQPVPNNGCRVQCGPECRPGDVPHHDGRTHRTCPGLRKDLLLITPGGIADCVGGPINTVCESERAEAISLAMSSRFGVGGVAFRVGCRSRKYVDTVAFGAYTRDIIDRIGGLDEEFVRAQDDEFKTARLRKLGGKILIAPEIRSRYTSRSSIGSLWQQYFQYGYWKVRVLQKHPRQMQFRHFVPAAFVGALLVSLVMMVIRPSIGNGCIPLPRYLLSARDRPPRPSRSY